MMVDGGIEFHGHLNGTNFFLGGTISKQQNPMGTNFEGFPEKIFVHCLGWCHITPVSLAEFWKKRLEF